MLRDYEELINSIPKNGIKGNEKISDLQLASYTTGVLCNKIAIRKQYVEKFIKPGRIWGFGELDVLAFQATPKSPYIFTKTLERMAINGGQYLDEKEKDIFAHLCASINQFPSDEMDSPAFLAGYMRGQKHLSAKYGN